MQQALNELENEESRKVKPTLLFNVKLYGFFGDNTFILVSN